jgi:multiple sugar transport system substrate-binding protein
MARFDGTLRAVPTTTDVRGMYWNRAAFEDAALDPESPPVTWSELLDVAETLHDPPERYGATYFVVGGRWTVNLFAAGGQVLSEDGTEPRFHEEPGVRAARFVDEVYNGQSVGPPDPPYQDGAAVAREFLRGQYGITVVEGSWLDYFWRNLESDEAAMPEQFGFAATPHPSDGRQTTMSGGHMWAGFAETDYPDVVRDFLRIAGSREFKRHLSLETGQIPTRKSLQDDDEVWDNVLYGDVVRDLLADTALRPVRNWSVVAEELDPALQRVAFDDADPEPALEEAAAAVRSEIG